MSSLLPLAVPTALSSAEDATPVAPLSTAPTLEPTLEKAAAGDVATAAAVEASALEAFDAPLAADLKTVAEPDVAERRTPRG